MRHLLACLAAISMGIAPAIAEEWSCRNDNAEISCNSTACEVTVPDGFTPTELTVDTSGAVSFCAYSGCWAGQASRTFRVGQFFTAVGLSLPWSGPAGSPGNVAATIDTAARVAVILADGFAHPMTCTTQ